MGFIEKINSTFAGVIRRLIDVLYIKPISKMVSKELFRYAVCGVGNYIALDALLYYIIYNNVITTSNISFFGGEVVVSSHIAAKVIVFPVTFLIGFWLNRNVAFSATQSKSSSQIVKYGVTVAGSILLTYILLGTLVSSLGLWAPVANIICSLTTATYSYLVARLYTFKK